MMLRRMIDIHDDIRRAKDDDEKRRNENRIGHVRVVSGTGYNIK